MVPRAALVYVTEQETARSVPTNDKPGLDSHRSSSLSSFLHIAERPPYFPLLFSPPFFHLPISLLLSPYHACPSPPPPSTIPPCPVECCLCIAQHWLKELTKFLTISTKHQRRRRHTLPKRQNALFPSLLPFPCCIAKQTILQSPCSRRAGAGATVLQQHCIFYRYRESQRLLFSMGAVPTRATAL